ncbi:hypothetical protein N7537_001384 [Penicillium hordei]|uniref:Uncharacterized protein n=1 Tax=Penicillium hordei TaxID=40994 RepID=A0AAD6EGK3_9EURO|nr:uncharacterized protein N7537_001384 [Penicillium hordei]KAJ5616270.1 hypothetical protein N7537_001384 [Penicillium hordei]
MSQSYPFIDPLKLNLAGKSVFITGTSKGIGLAIAISYAKAGASLIGIAARSSQEATIKAIQEAAVAAGKPLPKILAYKLDVTDPDMVNEIASRFALDTSSRLDILVNNAGYLPRFVPITESDPEDWWKGWEVNVKGVFLLTRQMLPIMLRDRQSDRTIVTLTSTSAHRVSSGGSSYQMTKLVNLRFSEFIGAEYGSEGVLAYAVNPGAVATEMGRSVCADTITYLTSEKRDWLQGRYLSALWNMEVVLQRKEEIIENDFLKVRMAIG